MAMIDLDLPGARRIALAAQGFAGTRRAGAGPAALLRNHARLHLHQIDSVNVLSRAHYLPAFSRLGSYDRAELDRLAWGPRRQRRMFEYWAHEASLLPFDIYPLLRWRMDLADRGEAGWTGLRSFAGERRAEAMALLAQIRDNGPMAAGDFETHRHKAGWWEWSATKSALEWLFWAGHITTATRRGGFERVYDLTERVLPRTVIDAPIPAPDDAHCALIERAARAHGIATPGELRDYFRQPPAAAQMAIRRLIDAGVLIPVQVAGWGKTLLHHQARVPRRVNARALLAPFDPLIWHRDRTERLHGFFYRIEIYVPAERRVHGYYVLPFLLGDRLVGRVDLKSDRTKAQLLVRRMHFEPDAPVDARDALMAELADMAQWLGLERVAIAS
jgi:uncharacterized protein YcaQ